VTIVSDQPLGREKALAELRALESELRERGVARLYLYGSVASDQARPDSDLDLFADLQEATRLGWEYFGIGPFIEERLGRAVQFTTRSALHEMLRPRIEQSAVRVF